MEDPASPLYAPRRLPPGSPLPPSTTHKAWAAAFGAVVTGSLASILMRYGFEMDPVTRESVTLLASGAGGALAAWYQRNYAK